MDPILIILIFIVLLITGIIISLLISDYNENKIKKYYSDLSFNSIIKDNGSNLKNCPDGCVRGICTHKNNCINPTKNNCCVYDFQCNYCKDKYTNNYYLDTVSNPKLTIDYNNNIKNINNLNVRIKKQNDYINKLNKEIIDINKKNGY